MLSDEAWRGHDQKHEWPGPGSFYDFFLSTMGALSERRQSCGMTQAHDEIEDEIKGVLRYSGQRTRGSSSRSSAMMVSSAVVA